MVDASHDELEDFVSRETLETAERLLELRHGQIGLAIHRRPPGRRRFGLQRPRPEPLALCLSGARLTKNATASLRFGRRRRGLVQWPRAEEMRAARTCRLCCAAAHSGMVGSAPRSNIE